MPLKTRIAIVQFLQFFIWGSWLITIGTWWFETKHWTGTQFGAVFSTIGIASLFIPTIAGILADRFINAEKLYVICHLCGAGVLFYIPHVNNPSSMFWVMLLNMCFYMATYPLSIVISYAPMKAAGMNIIKEFPPLRVFGTMGFIAAMWTISILHLEASDFMFYTAGVAAVILGIYGLTMPNCPPVKKNAKSIASKIGLDAFKLFKNYKMVLFFLFSILLGTELQLTDAYGDVFLHSFSTAYQEYIAVKYPAIVLSISQASEVCFLFAIPLFLSRFGIKKVMMISMIAWVFRFGLFGFGNPAGNLWMLILSCIVYGIAFDFFNISGSLYVESQVPSEIRASAQGLLLLMTTGIGFFLGGIMSGWVIDNFFTKIDGSINWQGINGVWIAFAIYAAIIFLLFTVMFRLKSTNDKARIY
jgi:MFS transporter, NHS family, xanthosine permease